MRSKKNELQYRRREGTSLDNKGKSHGNTYVMGLRIDRNKNQRVERSKEKCLQEKSLKIINYLVCLNTLRRQL